MQAAILKRPLVTEKTMAAARAHNVYTFEVQTAATKNQIKTAIEHLYQVSVTSVRTVTNQKELKRTGRKRLARLKPKTKKAYVQLAQDQTIPLFDVAPTE